jgi:hypothetical protein
MPDSNSGRQDRGSKDAASGFLSFWRTLPGIITGLAGLLGAIAALIPVLDSGQEPDIRQSVESPSPTGVSLRRSPSGRILVTATSTLPSVTSQGLSYYPTNTVDGDSATAWSEGDAGAGEGESITWRFGKRIMLQRIDIVNGYQKSPSHFAENSRVREALLRTEAGDFRVVLRDIPWPQRIRRSFGNTSFVTLEIKSVYSGSRYEDTLITEVVFWTSRSP